MQECDLESNRTSVSYIKSRKERMFSLYFFRYTLMISYVVILASRQPSPQYECDVPYLGKAELRTKGEIFIFTLTKQAVKVQFGDKAFTWEN